MSVCRQQSHLEGVRAESILHQQPESPVSVWYYHVQVYDPFSSPSPPRPSWQNGACSSHRSWLSLTLNSRGHGVHFIAQTSLLKSLRVSPQKVSVTFAMTLLSFCSPDVSDVPLPICPHTEWVSWTVTSFLYLLPPWSKCLRLHSWRMTPVSNLFSACSL